ncbi:MAG: hypothetical protein ACK4E7_02500 [Permianibacter sp.]
MNAWRLAAVLLTTTASVLAAEPAGGPEAELSLELLEFLGEYGTNDGELALPEDFDAALVDPAEPAALDPAGKPATPPATRDSATVAVEIEK